MEGRIIRIFLASSNELKDERIALGDFVNSLNYLYRKRGIYIELLKWEYFDAAYGIKRKQEEYNEKIDESDIFLAIFDTKVGSYTREEFERARQHHSDKGLPKIYTQFKKPNALGNIDPQLIEFQNYLGNELEHFYEMFDGVDTLKVKLILQIEQLDHSTNMDIKVSNSIVTINGQRAFLDYSKVQINANNKSYVRLKEELERKTRECCDAQAAAMLSKDDSLQFKARRLDYECEALRKEILIIESEGLKLLKEIIRLSSLPRQELEIMRKAAYCIENGDIDGAKDALGLEEIERLASVVDKSIEIKKEQLESENRIFREIIKMYLFRISTLKIDYKNPNRYTDIQQTYNRACYWECKRNEIGKEATYEYLAYLRVNDRKDMAMELANKLLEFNKLTFGADSSEVAKDYSILGLLYYDISKFAQAIENCEKSNLILTNLGFEQSETFINNLTTLAGSYRLKEGRHDKAVELNIKAVELCRSANPINNVLLAETLDCLGWSHWYLSQYTDAEKCFLESEKVLAGLNDFDSQMALIDGYCSLSWIYDVLGDWKKILPVIEKADYICQQVFESYPFNTTSAIVRKHMGVHYYRIGDYQKAYDLNKEALDILSRLSVVDDVLIGIQHFQLAYCLAALKQYDKAWKYLQYDEEMSESSSAADYGITYNLMGKIKCLMGDYNTGVHYVKKGIECAQKEYGEDHADVAEGKLILGQAYFRQGMYDSAKPHLKKSVDLQEKLLGNNHYCTAQSYVAYGRLLLAINEKEIGEDYINKAKEIFEQAELMHMFNECME